MSLFLTLLVFLIAGVVPELTGFGVATVAMSLLPFMLPFEIVLPLVSLISVVTTGTIMIQSRSKSTIWRLIPLVTGSFIGVSIGMYFLNIIEVKVMTKLFGGFLILYSIYGLLVKPNSKHFKKKLAIFIGFLAGFFSAAFNIHGPLVGMYESSDNAMSKKELKNTIVSYMFITGIFTSTGHYMAGRVTQEVLYYTVLALPFLFLGLYIGTRIFKKANTKIIKHLVYLLTMVSGVFLIL